MPEVLRILILEDSAMDVELIERELRRSEIAVLLHRVVSEHPFREALEAFSPDLVLTDSELPGFSGAAALGIVRERSRELPVIFVSGTIGEERAVELLKAGATDYVVKDHLARLPRVIQRAMHEVALLRERLTAEERHREIFENTIVGICQVSPDGHLVTANPALAHIFGYNSPSELMAAVSNAGRQLFAEEVRQSEFLAALKKDGMIQDFEAQAQRADGATIWVSITARAGNAAQGRFSYEAFVEDVTRRKELETQMLRTHRLESIGTLATGIAHDLNNVLAPILVSLPLLRADLPAHERASLVDIIESSAQRGAEILRHVLGFGRGVDGERVSVSPASLIREVAQIASQTFPKGIRTETVLSDESVCVMGDPTQLHQVLLNLCVNARDAMPGGGLLRIETSGLRIDESFASMRLGASPGHYVVIKVSDTGRGMPPDILERIFDPFFTTKEVGKGSGLGLPTVLGIVKSHGGFLDVASEVGHGSTFTIFLSATTDATAPAVSARAGGALCGAGELVLIADDEESIRKTAARLLEASGYRVLTARDGAEALALFVQNVEAVAVVVLDVMMPNLDGFATTRALRKLKPDVPIVVVTGVGGEAQQEATLAAGATSFLKKPFTADAILEQLHQVLHKQY